MIAAKVELWGTTIGAVSLAEGAEVATFRYDPDFVESGIQIAPLTMPLRNKAYEFPALARNTFHGLPGLLADSLPDKFGNSLIDAWLATQGRTAESFSPLERLCYTGKRGMGALEFSPSIGPSANSGSKIEIAAMVRLASEVLTHRSNLLGHFHGGEKEDALRDILSIGTSAGGARAKAVIAWNESTNEVRSGQIAAGDGFDYWLLKFDGVEANKDKETADPKGYGVIEYAYHLMAKAAGITMNECRLLEENGRRHFMTRRFDRKRGGEKLHMQSLCALAHFDFNMAGAYSYEQAMLTIRQLGLSPDAVEEQFRRMVFNVISRNQDDHVKNIAFLMNKDGEWSLSPAFDVTYNYNPTGEWTATHQMTINGKRGGFTMEDFKSCAKVGLMKRGRAETIIQQVREAITRWPEFADQAKLSEKVKDGIQDNHQLVMLKK